MTAETLFGPQTPAPATSPHAGAGAAAPDLTVIVRGPIPGGAL